MHETNRALGRGRCTSPSLEAWHDLSRYVAATRLAARRRSSGCTDQDGNDRGG